MEESQEILLESLANSGVSIPLGASSIRDLTPATLVSICSQSVHLIDPTSSLPSSLPDSMADRFKICTDLASALTNLGFIGDISFHKFLYPSEEDLYKLVRFLVRRLSVLPEELGEADKRNITNTTSTKENDIKNTYFKESSEKADNHSVDLNVGGVETILKDAFLRESQETRLNQQKIDESKEDISIVQDDKSMKRLPNSKIGASVNEESARKLTRKQSSEIRHRIEKLRSQEKLLMLEARSKALEVQHQEEEHELLKSAVEMAFDGQHTADFHIAQLNEQVDARRDYLMELETQL
ncbi:hypothetical protein U1Q18_023958 [Sarracenia purpurea var. burkii]